MDYLKILVDEIHSVIVSTIDSDGKPVTRVIDMMLYDENGIYFLTAKGKEFYRQLMEQNYLSLTGMTSGSDTMSRKSITISGEVKNIGNKRINEMFEKNSYMVDIYPTLESRQALEVFHLSNFSGSFFDLSTLPITRDSFNFGSITHKMIGYHINDNCKGCGICVKSCPSNCIVKGLPYKIIKENCLQCGNCMGACSNSAVKKVKH